MWRCMATRRSSRLRVTVGVRSNPAALLAAIREYATPREGKLEGRQWSIASRRPLVLRHASARVPSVRFTFSRDDDGVELSISGREASLGLRYATYLLAHRRLVPHVARFCVEVSQS